MCIYDVLTSLSAAEATLRRTLGGLVDAKLERIWLAMVVVQSEVSPDYFHRVPVILHHYLQCYLTNLTDLLPN